jgi:hypothetical protein
MHVLECWFEMVDDQYDCRSAMLLEADQAVCIGAFQDGSAFEVRKNSEN